MLLIGCCLLLGCLVVGCCLNLVLLLNELVWASIIGLLFVLFV